MALETNITHTHTHIYPEGETHTLREMREDEERQYDFLLHYWEGNEIMPCAVYMSAPISNTDVKKTSGSWKFQSQTHENNYSNLQYKIMSRKQFLIIVWPRWTEKKGAENFYNIKAVIIPFGDSKCFPSHTYTSFYNTKAGVFSRLLFHRISKAEWEYSCRSAIRVFVHEKPSRQRQFTTVNLKEMN